MRLVTTRLTKPGTIARGIGAGLRFDATGGYPGYLLGTTEPEEQALVAEQLASGDVFYDLGANIGFYSTIAGRLVGDEGYVYAFEPFPPSAAQASRNAEMNGLANVRVVQAAVSATEGRMTLALAEGGAKHSLGDGEGIEIDVVSIDKWMLRENARPPTFVMIDVEGAELAVLDGMRQVLTTHRPVVCCEVHWLGNEFLYYCRETLAPIGYTVTALGGGPLPCEGRWHAVLRPTVTDL